MMVIRKGDPDGKGVWFDCEPKDFDYHRAFVLCPICDGTISLRGRRINEEGIVFPSLVCPHGCRFNKYVQLEGWDKGAIGLGEIR